MAAPLGATVVISGTMSVDLESVRQDASASAPHTRCSAGEHVVGASGSDDAPGQSKTPMRFDLRGEQDPFRDLRSDLGSAMRLR